MKPSCPTCGTIGGGGFFREPTNIGDQPNGMQLIPCPACTTNHRRFRVRVEWWASRGLDVWLLLVLTMIGIRATHVIANSWWIVLFPLWGALAFFVLGPFVLRLLARVLYVVLWLIT